MSTKGSQEHGVDDAAGPGHYLRRFGFYAAGHGSLDSAVADSSRHGFRLVLTIWPLFWKLSDGYPYSEIHETVSSFARGRRIPTLDLLPAFAGFDGPELWVHPTNQHPNELAHRIAADTLYPYLREALAGEARHPPD